MQMINRFKTKFKTLYNLWIKPSNVKVIGTYFSLSNINFDIEKSSDVIIELGSGVKLSNLNIYIRGNNHKIFIGNYARVSKGIFWMEDHNCEIQIGNKTTIESAELACTEPYSIIEIGEDCMFSKNIELRTGDSHSIFENETSERINYAKNIKIANRVWVGAHAKILKGAEIKSDVVIGLGSIVLGGEPLNKNSIYGGFPAKCLKTGISWSRKRVLKNDFKYNNS